MGIVINNTIFEGCFIAVVLAALPGIARTADPAKTPKNDDNSKVAQVNKPALSAEIVSAWKKAGARVNWMSADESNPFGLVFRESAEGRANEVPTFHFLEWKAGVVAKLPQPQLPFGLELGYMQLTDADLKELARLDNLQSLALHQ